MISRAGPVVTSVVLVFDLHNLEAPGLPEILSWTSPQLRGAGRLVFVRLLPIRTCPEACWFRRVILLPLAASLQSRGSPSLSQHSPLDTGPALEPFLH